MTLPVTTQTQEANTIKLRSIVVLSSQPTNEAQQTIKELWEGAEETPWCMSFTRKSGH